ncbi:hypothetical protein ACMG4J_21075 [Rossellomorea marisflavi]|uniref:hypothetical protein n=1 Tax=Rossellomorea marisflavi TaxID=189381 RepID=UPI0039BFBCC1
MKKQRKLILSILTVFFLTLGVIGVTYGFSGEEEKAPTSKQVAGSENSVASVTGVKEKQKDPNAISDEHSKTEKQEEKKRKKKKTRNRTAQPLKAQKRTARLILSNKKKETEQRNVLNQKESQANKNPRHQRKKQKQSQTKKQRAQRNTKLLPTLNVPDHHNQKARHRHLSLPKSLHPLQSLKRK